MPAGVQCECVSEMNGLSIICIYLLKGQRRIDDRNKVKIVGFPDSKGMDEASGHPGTAVDRRQLTYGGDIYIYTKFMMTNHQRPVRAVRVCQTTNDAIMFPVFSAK